MALSPGDIVAEEYKVEALVGESKWGHVYQAVDEHMYCRVAIKELTLADSGLNPVGFAAAVQSFRRAAALQSELSHPNIVRALRLIELHRDRLVLIEDFVDGSSLRDHLAKRGRFAVNEAVSLFRQVLAGLEAVHKDPREIVHRDVKPSNILLNRRGVAKLADFGLAQVGEESLRAQLQQPHPGTPAYMSPEQSGTLGYLTPGSDIYSAGCVLFEMLTGVSYQHACREGETLLWYLPDAPDWLDQALGLALAEDPAQRFARARDFDLMLVEGLTRETQLQVRQAALEREEQHRALREELAQAERAAVEDRQTEQQIRDAAARRNGVGLWDEQPAQARKSQSRRGERMDWLTRWLKVG